MEEEVKVGLLELSWLETKYPRYKMLICWRRIIHVCEEIDMVQLLP